VTIGFVRRRNSRFGNFFFLRTVKGQAPLLPSRIPKKSAKPTARGSFLLTAVCQIQTSLICEKRVFAGVWKVSLPGLFGREYIILHRAIDFCKK
jgi:hypothetical protein